jgi:monoamine oxidase
MDDRGITRRGLIGGAAGGAAAASLPAVAGAANGRASRTADVAIVGAGLAGMTAARELVRAGRSVVVLEARRRVGGRVLGHSIGGGEVAELGGMFTGPTQTRIQALSSAMGVGTYPAYNEGNNVFYANGRRSEYPAQGPTGSAPPDPVVAPDIVLAVAQLNTMAEQVDPASPQSAAQAEEWDRQTLDSWLRSHTSGSDEFMAVVSAATSAIFGAEPRDLSLLFTLFYIAASGDAQNQGTFERNFNTAGGAQEKRFVGGAQNITQRLAARLGRRIVLGAPVRRIDQSRSGVTVVSDRLTVHAQRVIVAIPPPLAGRIDYEPLLPARRDQLTQRSPMGTLMKFEAIYDRPFWRDKGLSGQSVSENGPIKVTFDASPQDGGPGILMGFIGGKEARFWGPASRSARRAAALESLARYFGEEARSPREITEVDWSKSEWTRGCPVSVLGPGTLIDYGSALRAPVGRVHWAGSETSDFWNGYMDGAVRSGERASAEVLAAGLRARRRAPARQRARPNDGRSPSLTG